MKYYKCRKCGREKPQGDWQKSGDGCVCGGYYEFDREDVNINYSVDYYEILGLDKSASKAKIKINLTKKYTEFSNQVRNELPKTIRKEVRDELRNKLGREPLDAEVAFEANERIAPFSDKSKMDKRMKEATLKLRLAEEGRQILENQTNRKKYDKGYRNIPGRVTCHSHQPAVGEKMPTDGVVGCNKDSAKKWNSLYFCQQKCLDNYLRVEGWMRDKHSGNSTCKKCGTKTAAHYKKRKNGDNYCQSCWDRVPDCSQCQAKKGWYKSNQGGGSEKFCSQDCLDNFTKKGGGGGNKGKCANCFTPRPKNSTLLGWDIVHGKLFCSDKCTNEYFQKLKKTYKRKLQGLPGWNKLSDSEKNKFLNDIDYDMPGNFNKIVQAAQDAIKAKQGGGGGGDKNLPAEIQKAIREIEAELSQEPKITEKEQQDFHWRTYIGNSASLTELKGRKEEILNEIRVFRKQKILNQLIANIIQQVKNELARKPKVEANELKQPNWETELNALSEKSQIEKLRDEVLANITQKRIAKQVINQLDQLISQAQVAANNKDWEKLKRLLEKINSYHDNEIYESKQGIIKELEQKLAVDNFPEYQVMTANSVDEFLKKIGIKTSELNPENQNYQEKIKRAKTPEEAEQIKENAINDGGTKKAEKVVGNLLEEAKKADTDEQKSVIRQQINLLQNGNKWEKSVYEKYQNDFAKIIAVWASAANSQFGNKTTPPPGSKTPETDKGLPTPLIIFLVMSILGIIITGSLIIRNRQKKY